MKIITRVIEDGKDFCMDDLINIFAKGEGESAILTWVVNGVEQTEKCFYLDNNSSEVSVFYVKRNDRKFDKVFVTINIKQIVEVNHVRLSIIKTSVEKVVKEELESELKKKAIETFVMNWKQWLHEWEYHSGKRGGCKFKEAAIWIFIAEMNNYDESFVMNSVGCSLRNWMEWRSKFVSWLSWINKNKNRFFSHYREVIDYIVEKIEMRKVRHSVTNF
ncbi:MAG: hypothetical protein J6R59_01975 [Paludibacteraceae bacterium]|nr:hypothetical protein [Paludibacteraceae bacterium]